MTLKRRNRRVQAFGLIGFCSAALMLSPLLLEVDQAAADCWEEIDVFGNPYVRCDPVPPPPKPPPPGSGGPTWAQKTAGACADIPNQDAQAAALELLKGADGSGRLVIYVRECAISFVGDYVAELGRPFTNVESAMLDPANKITPNAAQTDQIGAYVAEILPGWIAEHPEFAPTTTTTAPSSTTVATTVTSEPVPSTSVVTASTIATTPEADSSSSGGDTSNSWVWIGLGALGASGLALGVGYWMKTSKKKPI